MELIIYVIMDNYSAHKGTEIRSRAQKNRVELRLILTNVSWARAIEARPGPRRRFTPVNSSHPNHTVQTRERL
ncbi:hypothetical protein KQY30_00110 [Streptomyces sp. GMY02]|uniref:hypothetical protein n=1 Tax=Streptomyces sp. GMY02 TaxID=1333528 RepID=UPI001C2BE3A0|nr:hypothetical protein KQY30_00110 [Streptomyces sp. GMY02]